MSLTDYLMWLKRRETASAISRLRSMFAFVPNEIRVPAHRPITFRLTSADVTHGFEIVGTNGNTMLVPGYVSQFTNPRVTVFDRSPLAVGERPERVTR